MFNRPQVIKIIKSAVRHHGLEGITSSTLSRIRTSLRVLQREVKQNRKFRSAKLKGDKANCLRGFLLVERIILAYKLSDFRSLPKEEKLGRLLLQWCSLYFEGKAEKVAKYISCNSFSWLVGQPLQEPIVLPFGWSHYMLLGGAARTWFKNLRNSPLSQRRLRIAQNFLYLKKGSPVVSESFKKDALSKSLNTLTNERVVPEILEIPVKQFPSGRVTTEVWMLKKKFKERLKATLDQVFEKPLPFPKRFWEPSPNASFYSRRSEGGAAAMLAVEEEEDNLFYPHLLGNQVIRLPSIEVNPVPEDRNRVQPVPLVEPFKVRVITKGPSNQGYILKGFQMALWSRLKSFKVFELIGKEIDEDCIPDTDYDLLSGDYSAATDNLSRYVSKTVAKQLALYAGLPIKFIVDSLVNNKIYYEIDGKTVKAQQRNGQLMGSILSFPVLCLANFVICSLSFSPDYCPSLDNPYMRINGDDCLFPVDDAIEKRWYMIADAFGLVPSVGKTYRSDRFCVMNSTVFYRKTVHSQWVRIPYANCDFLMPFKGKGGEPRRPEDLAPIMRQFLASSKGGGLLSRKFLHRLFMRYHRPYLDDGSMKGISWWLPQAMGGLGLLSLNRKPQVSKLNLKRAYAILSGYQPVEIGYKTLGNRLGTRRQLLQLEKDRFGIKPDFVLETVSEKAWYEKPKPPSGVSTLYAQALTGKVFRTDQEISISGNVPNRFNNRSVKDWNDLLSKRMFKRCDLPKFKSLKGVSEFLPRILGNLRISDPSVEPSCAPKIPAEDPVAKQGFMPVYVAWVWRLVNTFLE